MPRMMIALTLLGFSPVPAAWAACPAPPAAAIEVAPGTDALDLPGPSPAEAGGWVEVVEPPLHGHVGLTQGKLTYKPDSTFWTLGGDRLLARWSSLSRPPERVTLRLLARTARRVLAQQDFEGGHAFDQWTLEGSCELSGPARLAGAWGLEVTAGAVEGDGVLSKNVPDPQGNASQGSGATGGWRPPGSVGGDALCQTRCEGFTEATLVSLRGAGASPVASVRMRQDDQGLGIRLITSTTSPAGPWLPLSAEPHTLTLLANGTETGGSALLWVDRKLVALSKSPLINWQAASAAAYTFGLADVAGDAATTHFDQLAVFEQSTAILDCADSFEGPALSSAWGTVGAAGLDLESPGLSGDGTLAVRPDLGGDPPGALVTHGDLAGRAIRRLGVRLAFDPTLLEVPRGASVLVTGAANHFGTYSFRVLIEGLTGGALQMKVIARADSVTAPQPEAAFPLSRGLHTLELDWWRSETDVVATGTLRLWLDGEEKAALVGLHNPNQLVTEVGFGALTLAGAPSGKLLLDEIETWYEQ